jgi:NOL1/NOP2/fmu family ribosome biogenesis protein
MSWQAREAFPTIDLSREEALRYLKGEVLMPHSGLERGFYAVVFNDHPLGFVKNVGNRLNNLYPREWRIRMDI